MSKRTKGWIFGGVSGGVVGGLTFFAVGLLAFVIAAVLQGEEVIDISGGAAIGVAAGIGLLAGCALGAATLLLVAKIAGRERAALPAA